jgi:hypothetical protein
MSWFWAYRSRLVLAFWGCISFRFFLQLSFLRYCLNLKRNLKSLILSTYVSFGFSISYLSWTFWVFTMMKMIIMTMKKTYPFISYFCDFYSFFICFGFF